MRSRFLRLTSKIPPLGSRKNFDADVKKTTERHHCDNRFNVSGCGSGDAGVGRRTHHLKAINARMACRASAARIKQSKERVRFVKRSCNSGGFITNELPATNSGAFVRFELTDVSQFEKRRAKNAQCGEYLTLL